MPVDPKKPLRFKNLHDKRPVRLVGVLYNGNLVIESEYSNGTPWETPLIIDAKTGKTLYTFGGGKSIEIENAPVIESGFYPLSTDGRPTRSRGLISLGLALSEYHSARYFIEIVREDGKPKEAKIHARP